jgi:stage II sporulation protein M
MAGLFLVSFIIGYVFPVFFTEIIGQLLKELVEKTEGMNFPQLLMFIFQNNLLASFVGIIFGIILGLYPLFSGFFNGYVLGFVAGKAVEIDGVEVMWRLFPHGVFELPALLISLALGLRLGVSLFKKNVRKELSYNLRESMRVFLYVIIPLLILAAVIEAGLMILLS